MKQLPKSLSLTPREQGKLGLNRSLYYQLCDLYLSTKSEEIREKTKKEIESIIWQCNYYD